MTNPMTNAQPPIAERADLLGALDAFSGVSADCGTSEGGMDAAVYLDRYLKALEELGVALGAAQYLGLQNVCLLFQERIPALGKRGNDLGEEIYDALAAWPELLRFYLQSAPEDAATEAIVDHLQSPIWESTLAADDASVLQELLRTEQQGGEVGAEGFVPEAAEADGLQEQALEEVLPPQVQELVGVLIDEIPLMEGPLAKVLELGLTEDADPSVREDACELFADYLDRFADAAEAVGFAGLQQVLGHMRSNLGLLADQGRTFTRGEMEVLAAWSGEVGLYLTAPHHTPTCQALIDWLRVPDWPRPLSAEAGEALLWLLQAPTLSANDRQAGSRPQQATPEDVTLELPDDVAADLLDALLQELPAQTEGFSAAIQNLIADGSVDDVTAAQRIAHTVKGAGNTVGVSGLATLMHHLEDILAALAKEAALPTRPLAMSLMNAADCLEAMGEALTGAVDPPANAQAVLQEVLDWANRIDREGLPAAGGEALPASAGTATVAPVAATSTPDERTAERADKTPAPSQPVGGTTRVAVGLVDDLLRLGGETIILSGQIHEQVRRMQDQMRTMQVELQRLQRLGGELERLIDIKDLSVEQPRQDQSAALDSLEMDRYSELHTTSRMLVEAAADTRETGTMVSEQLGKLDSMLVAQEGLNRQTQEAVLSARMVPFKTMVPRLKRSVRQTCRLTGKQVEFHIDGADTLMDGEVLNELIDPLMHILRNAVDHGIEPPVQRAAAGKPDAGTLWLDLVREGNTIVVRCRDDGAGFDFAAIRQAAERRGLIEPGKPVSEEELKNLLLTPNFSTRSEVTQTSGRGVGLDVVYSHVLGRGGSLGLDSEARQGSTIELRLPVSLISTHALLVQTRQQVVAVADRGIERILHAADGRVRELGGQIVFQVGDMVYPLQSLDEILDLEPDRRQRKRVPMPVLLVRDRSGVIAVEVQKVSAGSDLVVKDLGHYVPRLPGIVGATILGDGTVTPVLDLPELWRDTRRLARPAMRKTAAAQDQPVAADRLPLALVVDDSLSARRALVQVMEDAGYAVREARDGMEAVQIADAKRPDIVLADMEMPRMNGIELTSHLRARPETADLPVIMITSRSTGRHRELAKAAGVDVYLTKPFLDDDLLDRVAALRGQV